MYWPLIVAALADMVAFCEYTELWANAAHGAENTTAGQASALAIRQITLGQPVCPEVPRDIWPKDGRALDRRPKCRLQTELLEDAIEIFPTLSEARSGSFVLWSLVLPAAEAISSRREGLVAGRPNRGGTPRQVITRIKPTEFSLLFRSNTPNALPTPPRPPAPIA